MKLGTILDQSITGAPMRKKCKLVIEMNICLVFKVESVLRTENVAVHLTCFLFFIRAVVTLKQSVTKFYL